MLNRPADQQDQPKKRTNKESVDELGMLRQQNEDLMKMVLEMRAKLMPDSREKKASDAKKFDKKKPFAKHRSTINGVWYEQNGRRYNGKFELVEDHVDVPAAM